MERNTLEAWLQYLQNLEPIHYIGIGLGVFVLLFLIIYSIIRGGKKRRARAVEPNFVFQSLQIAPLAKGVRIQLLNQGHFATITNIGIPKRSDLTITQGFTDYVVQPAKGYSVFCEAEGRNRADNGFSLQLDYNDQIGNHYRQSFHIERDNSFSEKLKLVRYK